MEIKNLEQLKQIFYEWQETGCCKEAANLNQKIKEKGNVKNIDDYILDTSNPQFFVGNPDAKTVLVMLNPRAEERPEFKTWEDYKEYYIDFGKNKYKNKTGYSKFDLKQISFLRAFDEKFDIFHFNDDKYHNLEAVIDKKLQLELIPYASKNFNANLIGRENIKPFLYRLLDIISEHKREHVIFCGSVFRDIFLKGKNEQGQKKYVVRDEFKDCISNPEADCSLLKKKDGTFTGRKYSVINLTLNHNSKKILACICPQYAAQGAPIEEYGKKMVEWYGKYGENQI